MTLTPPASPPSRFRKLVRAVGTVLLAAGVALLASLVATDVWHLGSDTTTASGGAAPVDGSIAARAGALAARDQLRALAEEHSTRALDHETPLRLLVAGDSISGGVGQALGDLTADTGIVDMHLDYRVGSGLFSGDRNWFERAGEDIRELQPEAVVFFAGTNDAVVQGRFTDEEYEARVGALMDLFSTYSGQGDGEVSGPDPGDDGSVDGTIPSTTAGSDDEAGDDSEQRTVLWVGAPTLRDFNDGAERVNELAARAAKDRDNVVYVDAFGLTAVDGEFDDTVTVLDGSQARIRSGDGVHFTNDGNEYLAAIVFELLDQRWALREQAEPGRPIAFSTADGGGTAPGIRSGSSGSSGSDWSGSSGSDGRSWSPPSDGTDDEEPTTSVSTSEPVVSTTPTTTPTTLPPTTTITEPPTTVTTAPPTTVTTAPPTTVTTVTTDSPPASAD